MSKLIKKDTQIIALSDDTRVCKTERFLKETSRFLGVDAFITQFAEGILLDGSLFAESKKYENGCVKLCTTDGLHTFSVRFGYALKSNSVYPKDIIFYAYEDLGDKRIKNDLSFLSYLSSNKVITFEASKGVMTSENDFLKLYVLFNSDFVNFPLLNEEQRKLVEIENTNVLVQGVAGSGKTNICIDKIIYSACRGYRGKVLYSTFSRGLLMDTREKIDIFKKNITEISTAYKENRIIFCGTDKKRALENKLGLFLNVEDGSEIIEKLQQVVNFLNTKVDFYLIRDLSDKQKNFVGEEYFYKTFLGNGKNRQLAAKLSRLDGISYELIYKELYGLIFGCADPLNPQKTLSLAEYCQLRNDGFSRWQCETIYSVANDYEKFLAAQNATDNNIISRQIISDTTEPLYSLAVIDEVQDYTQINLCMLKKIAVKLFCVGDALQMINPSFFSFAYLKRLLYEREISVAELKNNFRNTKRITEAVNSLSELNVKRFGTHSFVLKGKCVEQDIKTSAVYMADKDFAKKAAAEKPDNFTVVVGSLQQKEALRRILTRQEILTVSEIKGLERDTVVLFNLLSDNRDKWNALEHAGINRKSADENSVYRYYFNILYVGVSRAKANLFVVEREQLPFFNGFFNGFFEKLSTEEGVKRLTSIVSKVDVDREELIERIEEFIKFGQYDNARFAAKRLEDDRERRLYAARIDINEKYVQGGDYRGAGIAFWELGLIAEAKKMLSLSGDTELSELIDRLSGKGEGKLSVEIVKYYSELCRNESAKNLILSTITADCARIAEDMRTLKTKLTLKEKKKYGKR